VVADHVPASNTPAFSHFADQAEHPSVGDPVLEEFEQPSMVDGVEETSDVRIEHPVHLSRGQAYVQGV
jgi:hypothetical protein